MSLFAVDLEFRVEEYAASKGKFPPRKRKKKSLYIATIEKVCFSISMLTFLSFHFCTEISIQSKCPFHLVNKMHDFVIYVHILGLLLFTSVRVHIHYISKTIF